MWNLQLQTIDSVATQFLAYPLVTQGGAFYLELKGTNSIHQEGRLQRDIPDRPKDGKGMWTSDWQGTLRKAQTSQDNRAVSNGDLKHVFMHYCPWLPNGKGTFSFELLACFQLEVACRLGIPWGSKDCHRLQVWGVLLQICCDIADSINTKCLHHYGRQVH